MEEWVGQACREKPPALRSVNTSLLRDPPLVVLRLSEPLPPVPRPVAATRTLHPFPTGPNTPQPPAARHAPKSPARLTCRPVLEGTSLQAEAQHIRLAVEEELGTRLRLGTWEVRLRRHLLQVVRPAFPLGLERHQTHPLHQPRPKAAPSIHPPDPPPALAVDPDRASLIVCSQPCPPSFLAAS